MLPKTIYNEIGSLKHSQNNEPRFAISLFFYVNEDGMIVYEKNLKDILFEYE